MAYSNDQTQIRMGLVNYIGALIKASPYPEKAAKHNVAAILSEETLKFAQDENGLYDLYIIKPLLRAATLVFKQRIAELKKLPKTKEVQAKIDNYIDTVKAIEELINVL